MKTLLSLLILGTSFSSFAGYECKVNAGLMDKKIIAKNIDQSFTPGLFSKSIKNGVLYYSLSGEYNCLSENDCSFDGYIWNKGHTQDQKLPSEINVNFTMQGKDKQSFKVDGKKVTVTCDYNNKPFAIEMSSNEFKSGEKAAWNYWSSSFKLVEVEGVNSPGKSKVKEHGRVILNRKLFKEVECLDQICKGMEITAVNGNNKFDTVYKVLNIFENDLLLLEIINQGGHTHNAGSVNFVKLSQIIIK